MRIAKKHKFITALILAAAIIIAAALVWARSMTQGNTEEQAASIKETISSRALQCYVIEGAYPESLDYLMENYGLAVNTEDYRIVYIPYAENLPPEIKVVYRDGK